MFFIIRMLGALFLLIFVGIIVYQLYKLKH